MSQENVEIIRRSLEAFQRGEFDLSTALWDAEGEWIPAMAGAVQLRDMKGWAVVETMPPSRLALYGQICGATLAPAHARTGDAAKITGYLGDDDTFDRAIERFAVAYADQNDADHAAFSQAADEPRIAVQRGG